jgi:transcriptional regulator with XRE-family HTH domain
MDLTPPHVRAARGLLKMTKAELAKLSGVSETTIRGFENGKVKPSEDTLVRLRAVFEERRVRFFNGGSPGVRLVGLADERGMEPSQ